MIINLNLNLYYFFKNATTKYQILFILAFKTQMKKLLLLLLLLYLILYNFLIKCHHKLSNSFFMFVVDKEQCTGGGLKNLEP